MKLYILLVVTLVFTAQGMNLLKQDWFDTHPNVEWVFEALINGTDYVGEELYSFEYNVMKFHYTSPDGNIPAFDALFDYTKGEMLLYFNLTGDCQKVPLEKMDMKAHWRDVFYNHTEYAGKRGHLDLYEAKEPDHESRRWVYGFMARHQDTGKQEFVPTRLQVHNPYSHGDYSYQFIDTLTFPKVKASDFEYPQCDKAELTKMDISLVPSAVAANPYFIDQVVLAQTQ